MVVDERVQYILDHYLDRIRERFAPAQVWVWGSRAYGHPHEYSDVDMILVSQRFAGLSFFDRRDLFREETGILDDPAAEVVDVLSYTTEEFDRKVAAPTIVREAVRKGIRVE
jgi:predicted nucleotidyltransferase